MTRVSAIFGFFCNSNPNFRSRPVWSEKKSTTIVQNIFQVLSDSFGLMMQMYIPFGSDSTCILSVCYTHITNFGDTSKLSTGEVCILCDCVDYQQDLELFHAMPSLTKESFSQNIWWPSSSVLNANFCLLKTTIITGNLTSLTCHWLFYYSKEEKKMPALGHMNNFFFSFVLDF